MIDKIQENMVAIALFQPEIPANTGNIIRLAACLSVELHLIHPLGFNFDDKHLRRAGLDYHDLTRIIHHESERSFREASRHRRVIGFTTKSSTSLWEFHFKKNDILLFGPETRGLPTDTKEKNDANICIPMNSATRSLNLSNAAAVAGYEALRQLQ